MLTHDALAASAEVTNARVDATADDHWLACLPLAHIGGLAVVIRALLGGQRLTVLPGFDADAVAASDATLVSLVVTALGRVDPTRFRTIVVGGSRPPIDPPPNVVSTYGMTESGSGIVYDGVPLDGVEIRIDEHDEIHVRGPMLLRAYRDGRDPKVDGWYPTGDLGSWRPDGRLHVQGRAGDMIVTGGEKVWPEPVEAILRTVAGRRRRGRDRSTGSHVGPGRHRPRGARARRTADARRAARRGQGSAGPVLRAACARAGRRDPTHRPRQAPPCRTASP